MPGTAVALDLVLAAGAFLLAVGVVVVLAMRFGGAWREPVEHRGHRDGDPDAGGPPAAPPAAVHRVEGPAGGAGS